MKEVEVGMRLTRIRRTSRRPHPNVKYGLVMSVTENTVCVKSCGSLDELERLSTLLPHRSDHYYTLSGVWRFWVEMGREEITFIDFDE